MGSDSADFGVVGLAVMGRNLALNVADHGFRVAVYNRSFERTQQLTRDEPDKALVPCESLEAFTAALTRPRRILLMVKAGEAVDQTMAQLEPLLAPGDIVIDGGNSFFEDTRRREADWAKKGLSFVGCGISGGEEGARHGPSLMPGGSVTAWKHLQPILEAISAHTDSGPCVTHVGPDGAGHFVKMVHNGIEYGDMQLIAEAYDILQRGLGMSADALAAVFTRWNDGRLESFLIEITARIFAVKDPASGQPLVDLVLDRAGQKGTGRWTAQVALEQGVAIPTIAAAIDARVLSSQKEQRVAAEARLRGPRSSAFEGDRDSWVRALEDALYASKVCSYAQGMQLIQTASERYGWSVSPAEMARIWKGGCIIRARLLDEIMRAFAPEKSTPHLLLGADFIRGVAEASAGWRRVVAAAAQSGLPVPAMAASLSYFDSYRTARLPQNLTQAQRDAFGSHGFARNDDPGEKPHHHDWLG